MVVVSRRVACAAAAFFVSVIAAGGAAAVDPATTLMRLADEACFRRGGDAAGLKKWLELRNWTELPDAALNVHVNAFTTLIGGWTTESEFGALAIIHSRFKPPHEGYVCSLTMKPLAADLYPQMKAAFARKFGAGVAEEIELPDQHTDRYWLERERSGEPPVKASMIHTRPTSTITIRMIHGSARPLGS